jgi:hypothetical protein
MSRCLTSPCSRRAAAQRRSRREPPGPRPAAEGQLVRRGAARTRVVPAVIVAWSFLWACHDPPQAQQLAAQPSTSIVVRPGAYHLTVTDRPFALPSTVWLEPEFGATERYRYGGLKPHLAETTGWSKNAMWAQYQDGRLELSWGSGFSGISVSLKAIDACTWEGTASNFYDFPTQGLPEFPARLECTDG